MALLLSTLGSCEMPENGPWTDQDVYNAENNVEVQNGIPSGTNGVIDGMIKRAYLNELTDKPNEYIDNAENVNRVKQIFTQNDWDDLFSEANPMYATYDGLILAIAHYRSFCGEDAEMADCGCAGCIQCYSHDEMCITELATLFAHMAYETRCNNTSYDTYLTGLCLLKQQNCSENTTNPDCDDYNTSGTWEDVAFPPEIDKLYFGRGAIMLKTNSFYGQFGRAYWFDRNNGDKRFLQFPKWLSVESGMSFTSALWRYMTPQYPKPSIHDVIIGKFKTNQQYHEENIYSNAWGVTTNIMNYEECGGGAESESESAAARAQYYNNFYDHLKTDEGSNPYGNDDLGCKDHGDWPEDYANQEYQIASWWQADSTNSKQCYLGTQFTKYSIYNKDDYKRCVCDNMGQPEDCQQVGPRFFYWSETTESLAYTTANIDVYIGTSASYDIWTTLQNININPGRVGVLGNNVYAIDFWTISLFEDNIGRKVDDAGFESDYTSLNDPYIAVPDTYIASSLQQYSARVSNAYTNTFTFDYDQSLLGMWTFQIQACIEWFEYDEFDCSGYFEKYITFTLLDPCENPDDVPDTTELIEDICVLDEGAEVINDYLPYFDSWDDNELVQVIAGESYGPYQYLPETYDCCDNTIDISVNLSGVATFIDYFPSTNQFSINPPLDQIPKLYRIPITLDNDILTQVYYLNIVVHSPDQTIPGTSEPAEPIQHHDEMVQSIVNATVNYETAAEQLTEAQQQILQATNEFGEKLLEQFLMQQQALNDEEQEHPTIVVQSFSKLGELTLIFSQPMIVPYFTSEYNFSTVSHGTRLLQTVDLSSLIECDFKQDAKGSMPIGQYNVTLIAYRPTEMVLQFDFENPLHASAGNEFDAIECEIKNSAFFMSSETFLTVEEDTAFESVVPRQFQSIDEYITVQAVGTTIEAVSGISFLVQIVVMLLVGLSLKLMWNLMNVMQVLAFLRLFANCPQIMNAILEQVHNSITFDPLVQKILDYSKSSFEIASTKLSDEELQKAGIHHQSIFRSLGIFAFLFTLLAILTLIFLLLNFLYRRYKDKLHPHVNTVKKILKKKLQYQSFVRYFIESNLKITHTSLFFLVLTGSFSSVGEAGVTILRAVLLFAAISFPVFVVLFLNTHRSDLEESKFVEKWDSMYMGIKLEHRVSLFYTAVFCFRRILLVLCLLTFGQEHDKLIIFGALVIQNTYLGYILYVEPHTENIFNILEVINEYAVVLLLYIMFAFVTDSLLTLQEQQTAGCIAIGLLIIVFLVNLSVMLKYSLGKVYTTWKMKKQKKAGLAAKANFNESQAKKTALETIQENDEINFYHSQTPKDKLVSNKSDLEGSNSVSSNSDYENEQQTQNFNRPNQSQCVEELSRPNRVPSNNPDANIPDPRKFKSLVITSGKDQGVVVDGQPRMSTPTKHPVINIEYHLEINKDEEKKVELMTVSQYQGLNLERLTERSAHTQPPNSSQQQQRCEQFVQQHNSLYDVSHISDIDSIDNEEQKVARKNSERERRYETHEVDPAELLSNVMLLGKDQGGTLDNPSMAKLSYQQASCLYDYATPSPSVRQRRTPTHHKSNNCLGVLVPATKDRNSNAQLKRKDKAISKKSSQMSNLYIHKVVKEKKIGNIYDDMSELY